MPGGLHCDLLVRFGPAAGEGTARAAAGGGKMAAHKLRTTQQRDAVRADIAARYKAGATQTAIGAALGLTQQQISYYLKGLLVEWRTQAGADMDAKLQQELAKLDWLEGQATADWERSRKREGKLVPGDARFLELIKSCVAERCKLFGLYAPVRNTLGPDEAGPLTIRIEYAQPHADSTAPLP